MSDTKAHEYTHFKDVFAALLDGKKVSPLEFSPELQAEIQDAPFFRAGLRSILPRKYHWTQMFLSSDLEYSLDAFMGNMVYYQTMHDLFRLRTAVQSGELVMESEEMAATYKELLGANDAKMSELRGLVTSSTKIGEWST